MIPLAEVAQKFSKAAQLYSVRADVQQVLAVELAARMKVKSGAFVLDVGTGTGSVVHALKVKQPEAVYIGLDVAEGMLALAQGLRVRADCTYLPFKKDSFDIIVSASSYHWVEDMRAAFISAMAVLKPGGCFGAVLFGKDTLKELFTALGHASPVLSERLALIPKLPSLADVCAAISVSGITAFDFETEIRKVKFTSIREIIRWIRETGANGLGPGMFIGKDVLGRAEEYYAGYCNGEVSFELIWLEARK